MKAPAKGGSEAMPPPDLPPWSGELLILYQVTSQELIFFRQQQWAATNYVLLLHAALLGVRQFAGQSRPLPLCLIASLLSIIGVSLLLNLEWSIRVSRERLGRIRQRFPSEFRDIWEAKHKAPQWPTVVALLAAMVAASAMVCWLA